MSENRRAQDSKHAPGARFDARFWDAVEVEIEVLDASDFALFEVADQLPIEPRPGFAEALGQSLSGRVRARFSN
jgi:hypothetical protein